MTALAERLREKYFNGDHPYRTFEQEVARVIDPAATLLDAGCGRTAPALAKFKGRARRLIGVDLVDWAISDGSMELLKCDLACMPLADGTVDVVMSRSVMEHVTDPARVYGEVYRVLRPGGHFVFLTANLWDYASIIASIVPNRLHPWIVSKTEGRAEQDVFPVAYRSNTRMAVRRWATAAGFELAGFRYLGQYPAYFMFNGGLFWLATGYEKLIGSVRWLNFLRGWLLVTLRKPSSALRLGAA